MIKTITIEWLQSQGACEESIEEWHKETDHDTFATLNRLVVKNPEWGNWLVCRLMTKKQAVKYAVFAAEQVIDIYEKAYPDDKRPRNAIEAAKAYLKNPCAKTRAAAAAYAAAAYAVYTYAAAAAYAVAYAADATEANAAANAAVYAAYAAYAAAYAAYAAADAAVYAAYAAYAAVDAAVDAAVYVVDAVVDAVDAAVYVVDAVVAAANERRKMQAKILKYGIGLLKQERV